ncbi:MAG TPA: pyridoxal-dependent decarboxylase [Polyangiaceae bacterium]|nr:pyridoxal-dependent decarboxylase [Polyangiaceae bacterium]
MSASRAASESLHEPALRRALELALEYLAGLNEAPVAATLSGAELRQRIDRPLPETGRAAERVVSELAEAVRGGILGNAGGRFFGWVMGGSLPAALAADWLTSAWDQNPGGYAVAPSASVLEEVCGRWLIELLGLPEQTSFALVTGCQMAHFTCLAAARNGLLAARGWDVEQRGLFGAPPLRVVTSDQRHGTVERALRMLGLGRDCLLELASDAQGQLAPAALERALASAGATPSVVVLQAGDVNTGAFDPFPELIEVARRAEAWVHVDGAFGLWAAASPEYRHFTRGVELADSWATDGHKWLNVPYDCGYAFVRHPEPHYRSFSHHAAYLQRFDQQRDAVDWGPDHSRRARSFATYAALLALGRQGVARLVEDCCRHARSLVAGAGRLPGVEVVSAPLINQALLRFPDPRPGAGPADHDRRTEEVMARINATGEALFTGTRWREQRCMRVSVCSWLTSDRDVERAVAAIAASL